MAPRTKQPTPWRMYAKMGIGGSILCIGGPLLTMWLMPTEEELFLRYNPELQRRSLENRQQKQEDFDQFVRRLTEYNKSDKPIWQVATEDEANRKKEEANRKKEAARSALSPSSKTGAEVKLAQEIQAAAEKEAGET